MLLKKYKRRPDAWNKHAVLHVYWNLESEAASFSANTAHLFRLISWLLELDSGTRLLCNNVLYSIALYFHHQSHPQLGAVFSLAPSLHCFWYYFSTLLQKHIRHIPTWGIHFSVSYLFAFSFCPWGSQGNYTEVACHSLLQWTTFCQNSPPWPSCLG